MTGLKKWVVATLTMYLCSLLVIFICSCLSPERAGDNLYRIAMYSSIIGFFLLIELVIYLIIRWDERKDAKRR